jgi:protocatechuate 3,4-dioxygenase alpha subunit
MPTLTPSQTVGPFFATDLYWRDGGRVLFGSHGRGIVLTGRVLDGAGAPVADALVETWQADPEGKAPAGGDGDRPHGYARVRTGLDGGYRIETLMPGAVAAPGGARYAPQLSVMIFARGLLKAVVTRVFLADPAELADDPLARTIGDPARLRTLVAARDPGDPSVYRWDVRLQGEGETVFIEL